MSIEQLPLQFFPVGKSRRPIFGRLGWGLEKLNLGQRNDLLELMEDRHGSKSTLVTSQLPVKDWHAAIGDATLADAILDRLVHNAHRIALKGKSMRSMTASAQRLNPPS